MREASDVMIFCAYTSGSSLHVLEFNLDRIINFFFFLCLKKSFNFVI